LAKDVLWVIDLAHAADKVANDVITAVGTNSYHKSQQ
jgi:hypothetical protein